jgi:hypothetical protein
LIVRASQTASKSARRVARRVTLRGRGESIHFTFALSYTDWLLLAYASLMTLAVSGRTMDEAKEIAEQFLALVTASSPPDGDDLGDLAVLAGVRNYPGRLECATLPWHALRAAIEGT